MYRFKPHGLAAALYQTSTGVQTRLEESEWKQLGFMCASCGYMEFFAQNPERVIRCFPDYFESTEPE